MINTKGGKVINTAFMSAVIVDFNSSFDATKAGVVHVTKALALEWGKYNINMALPSFLWVALEF